MNAFERNIFSSYGKRGLLWLKSLPKRIEFCKKKWDLSHLEAFPSLSHAFVASCIQASTKKTVLKINIEDIKQETFALTLYNGNGCVRLLERDYLHGAFLLEKIEPAASLVPFFPDNDEESIKITANIIKKLHTQPLEDKISSCLPSLTKWIEALTCSSFPIPRYYLEKAKSLANDLLHSSLSPVILHGDLHHGNILQNKNEWIALDPKGIWGDPGYEPAPFIHNPFPLFQKLPCFKARELVHRRISLFSEYLHIDQERIKAWAFVHAILAACWSHQNKLNSSLWLQGAHFLN